jgi:hypothetical protein
MEAIIFISGGIAILYIAIRLQFKISRLKKSGLQTEGIIFDVVNRAIPQILPKYPIIRFVTLAQKWITEKYSIGTLSVFPLKKGKKIKVFYNPENPREFIVKSDFNAPTIVLLLLCGVLVLIIGTIELVHI